MATTSKRTALALPTSEEVQPLHCLEIRFNRATPLEERIERANTFMKAIQTGNPSITFEARVLQYDLNVQDMSAFFTATGITAMNVEIYMCDEETANNVLFNLRPFFQVANDLSITVNAHLLDWALVHHGRSSLVKTVIQLLEENDVKRIILYDLHDRKDPSSTQEACENTLYNLPPQSHIQIGYCASSYERMGRSVQKMRRAKEVGIRSFHINLPSGKGSRYIPPFSMLDHYLTDSIRLSATWDD